MCKLEIYINKDDKSFNYDHNKLYAIIAFVLYHNLKKYSKELIPTIYVSIDRPDIDITEIYGYFCAIENNLHIDVSTENIIISIKNKMIFSNKIKSFFYILLHEIYHCIDFVEKYIKYGDKNKSAGTYLDFLYSENQIKLQESIKKYGDDECNGKSYCLYESNAEWFAFNNLSMIENLYNYEGILSVPIDFFRKYTEHE